MARDAAKTFDHILIRNKGTVPAFTIGGVTYHVFTKVPATAYIKLSQMGSVAGMRDFIIECLAEDEQKLSFLEEIVPNVDTVGLDELIKEIVEVATPFDPSK